MGMIVALPNNAVAAAFQESSIGEGCNDQSIFLTLSHDGGQTWSPHTIAASADYACWGPVLHYDEETASLWLFYSVCSRALLYFALIICQVSSWQQDRTPTNCGSLRQSYPGGSILFKQSNGHSQRCFTCISWPLDLGVTWSEPITILPFESRGTISKMTANTLLKTENGSLILPFWEEGRTVYDLVPDCSAVLISEDKGVSWTPYGCISNNQTWLIENTIARANNGSLFQVSFAVLLL
jgi:predicted neuraminidase